MHQKYNVIQGMQLIYCNFFYYHFILIQIVCENETIQCVMRKKNAWKRVYMQLAFKRITFKTRGEDMMNCKFAFLTSAPWFIERCHGNPFHMPASHAKRCSFPPVVKTHSAACCVYGCRASGERRERIAPGQMLWAASGVWDYRPTSSWKLLDIHHLKMSVMFSGSVWN